MGGGRDAIAAYLAAAERQQGGAALFGFDAALSGAQAGDTLQWALHEGAENSFSLWQGTA